MHESDLPAGDSDELDPEVDPEVAAAASELDELSDGFDTVDAALKALDGDDLDHAEALVASLEDPSAVDTDDGVPESPSSEA